MEINKRDFSSDPDIEFLFIKAYKQKDILNSGCLFNISQKSL